VTLENQHRRTRSGTEWTFLLVQREVTTGRVLVERPLTMQETPLGVRTRLAVTSDGSAVIGFRGRSIYVWPTDPDKPARRVTVAKKDVWDAALHPSGRWVLTVCNTPEVMIWDTASWKMVQTYDWGIGQITCAAISPDGFLAAVGSHTGKVVVWDWEV
jgi:WD40 repeat protein